MKINNHPSYNQISILIPILNQVASYYSPKPPLPPSY